MTGRGLVLATLFALMARAASEDAVVNTTYYDSENGRLVSNVERSGMYGYSSSKRPEWGWLVHVKTEDGHNHGCTVPTNMHHRRWIALIKRGDCKFQKKIENAAITGNASAVVIYNNVYHESMIQMSHDDTGSVAVFIPRANGEQLATLVDGGTEVWMSITQVIVDSSEVGFVDAEAFMPTTTSTTTSTTTTTTRPKTKAAAAITKPAKDKTDPGKYKDDDLRKYLPRQGAPQTTTDVPPVPEGACTLTVSLVGLSLTALLTQLLW